MPWTAVDELWYEYRDPLAEEVPGALARLQALRTDGGWNVPFAGGVIFIRDGESKDADLTLALMRAWEAIP